MRLIEKLTLVVGTSSVILHITGIATQIEYINFVAACLGRVSAILYLTCLDKFRFYSLIPLIFAILNVTLDNRALLYLELSSQGLIYQIIAFITFKRINHD